MTPPVQAMVNALKHCGGCTPPNLDAVWTLLGHLTRLDFHQLDGSLVGCSFSHYALQTMMHSTAYCFSRV